MKNKRSDIPPIEPEKIAEPQVIRKEDLKAAFFGPDGYRIPTWRAVISDKLHFSAYSIPPGGRYEPPDVHYGDEVYYILKGTLTMLNPETGEVLEVHAGEALWIPAGTWHQGHNFREEDVYAVLVMAPRAFYPEKGVPKPPYHGTGLWGYEPKKSKLYKVS